MSDNVNQQPQPGSEGSESPRSLREYHRGSGTLTGGGVQEIYISNKPDLKKYKSKLDQRLGFCILGCFVTIAVILCIYGVMHNPIHDELTVYLNRTHQIAQELKLAMDDYPGANLTDGRPWMSVEELEDDANLVSKTNSALWSLFIWNVVICVILAPIVIFYRLKAVEGNGAKFVYRIILLLCLLFCIAQFLYLVHPILWGAAKFPAMLDRLFVEANPRDEYHLTAMEEKFACTFNPHETLVQFDLQQPCLPKMKNSLLPTYSVVLLILIDLFPFIFAIFIYSWDACLKNSRFVSGARKRVELNNSRRVPFPRSNVYVPPDRKLVEIE